ncbi:LAMI_0H15302g1_1 [Lachancea mirantina]|uniref:LAMI_0H15302g1_1 n=1 Tax=Lachancea mirantina TaxID=1230905 RepID=A0A1G4KIU6_9SACH|nr:LAMI_0H15302g1_1 [Lachancea mirantina]
MGAIISLPVTAAGTFLASFFGSLSSTVISQAFQSLTRNSSSLTTRLSYAIWLLLNSLVSWLSMSTNKSFLWPKKTCTLTGECGFFTVYRLNFALGMMHILLAGLLVGVKSTGDKRAQVQNSWWSLKILFYVLSVVASFSLPNGFYIFLSKWISLPSGVLFILIGLILLVDFAYEWAETCIQHVEAGDEYSSFWQKFLITGTSAMYLASLIMTIAMYVLFCPKNCTMNKVAVTVNLLLTLATSLMSVHPRIQEANSKSGLAQSSMVAAYCTYLTMSALASEPDERQCNPLIRSAGTRKASVILGSLFTFIAIAYTTTRAAANSAFASNNQAIYLDGDDQIDYDGIGQTRSQLRLEAIRQAVEEGSLPESALYDTTWLGSPAPAPGATDSDDERISTRYNYSLFHIIFFLATQWIAVLLTINVTQDDVGYFIPVGRTYFYSWVKIVSAWFCYVLYGWTVVAPLILPDRFGYEDY